MEESLHESTKEKIISDVVARMHENYHCSEAILLAAKKHYIPDLDPLAVRLSTPFAGGVGCSHMELCGALSGGLLVIGALYGREDAGTNDDLCQELALHWRDRFARAVWRDGLRCARRVSRGTLPAGRRDTGGASRTRFADGTPHMAATGRQRHHASRLEPVEIRTAYLPARSCSRRYRGCHAARAIAAVRLTRCRAPCPAWARERAGAAAPRPEPSGAGVGCGLR